jgi:excisionase family DNA binding protein
VQVEQQHEYLKVPEVAEVLRIARSHAYELVGRGEIPSVRIGRSVRVSRKELDQFDELRRNGVLVGLEEVLGSFGVEDAWMIASFFLGQNGRLGDKSR